MSAWYLEAALATHLKVSKNDLENCRVKSLTKKEWRKKEGGFEIAPAGLQKILEALGCSELDCSPCLVGAPAAAPEAPLTLIVNRVYPNPHLLDCLQPAENGAPARRITVRVPMNRNFRPRMVI